MKPLSPVLFLTAVQAVALRSRQRRDPFDCAVEFVQEMGRISHMDGMGTSTSWPFADLTTLEELVQAATTRGMVRRRPQAGDLAILGGTRIGVVIAVMDHSIGPRGFAAKCRLVWAEPVEPFAEPHVVVRFLWCGHRPGDLFVRWHDARANVRRAS